MNKCKITQFILIIGLSISLTSFAMPMSLIKMPNQSVPDVHWRPGGY